MSSPKTIKSQLDTLKLNPPKYAKYTKDDPNGNYSKGDKKSFTQTPIKIGGKPLRLKMTGDLFMIPTRNEHVEYGLKYKVKNFHTINF